MPGAERARPWVVGAFVASLMVVGMVPSIADAAPPSLAGAHTPSHARDEYDTLLKELRANHESGTMLLDRNDRVGDLSRAEMLDIADLANSEGISLNAAVIKYGGFEDFAELRDRIARDFPTEFSYGTWSDGVGTIYTIGTPSEQLSEEVAQSSLSIHTRVSPTGRTDDELMRTVESLYAHLTTFAPGAELVLGHQPEVIQVLLPDALPESHLLHAIEASTAKPLMIEWLPFGTEDPELSDNVLRGGAHVDGCLASFVLKHPVHGAARVGTAAHCVTLGTQVNYRLHTIDGGTSTTLNVLASGGTTVDIALLSHGGWNGNVASFYADWDIKRMVYSRQTTLPAVSDPVCHFRKVDGSQCSTVYERRFAGGWWTVIMTHDRQEPGDSGGPWYYGNRAYGSHVGRFTNWKGAPRAFFTPVQHFQDRWNYPVLVAP